MNNPTFPDRIPYNSWINSQLSVARHYGGMVLQGKQYHIEPETNDLVYFEPKKKEKKPKQSKESRHELILNLLNKSKL